MRPLQWHITSCVGKPGFQDPGAPTPIGVFNIQEKSQNANQSTRSEAFWHFLRRGNYLSEKICNYYNYHTGLSKETTANFKQGRNASERNQKKREKR